MNTSAALWVCLALAGCAERLPQARAGQAALNAAAFLSTFAQPEHSASRLGPPSPRGLGLRRVDRAASVAEPVRN